MTDKIATIGIPGLGKTALADAIRQLTKDGLDTDGNVIYMPDMVITVQRSPSLQHDRIDHDGTRHRVEPYTPLPFTATVLVVVPATPGIGHGETLICKAMDEFPGSVQSSMVEWVQDACTAAGLDPEQRVILVSPFEATPGNAIDLDKPADPYKITYTFDCIIPDASGRISPATQQLLKDRMAELIEGDG
jgi:hypothetical protein